MAFDVFITILLGAITVVLTALGVLLAALGIGLAALAFWGFTGVKEELNKMATRRVGEAMDAKLKEYPSGESILALLKRLELSAEFYEQTQSQLVTPPEPNTVESASKAGITSEAEVSSPTSTSTAIEPYPGEEANHVGNASESASRRNEDIPHSGADPRQIP